MAATTLEHCRGACAAIKPRSEFHRCAASKDGLQSYCKVCQTGDMRLRYTKRGRFHRLLREHGLTHEKFDALLLSQAGRCANEGCATPLIGDRVLHIDHDHRCCPGKQGCAQCVRGLLCQSCNTAVGMLGDDSSRARGAAEYLERTRV